MNILTVVATVILVCFCYFYFFKLKQGFKVKKRSFDFSGKEHKFISIGEHIIDHCAICEKLIIYGNLFGSKVNKCLACDLVVHKICFKLKGVKDHPCKKVFIENQDGLPQQVGAHQWAMRRLDTEIACSVCQQICNNIAQFNTFTCLWCNKVRHKYCKDFGRFEQLSILPHEIKMVSMDPATKKVQFEFTHTKSIPVFIVNKLSGPQFGESVLEFLYQHLNPIQVIDLLDEGIDRLALFKGLSNLKIIVAGGDGTMGGLIDPCYQLLGKEIKLIPMPLGTGNDLSRALGWGPGISTKKDVKYFLKCLETNPRPTLFDRWRIKITSKKNPEKILLDLKMLLYFGIGLDAKFSYQFNHIRKKFPYLFKTRTTNKFFYSQLGTFNLIAEKKLEMNKCLEIEAADRFGKKQRVNIAFTSENIVFQNTSFWGGGCYDMWNSYQEIEDDKISVTSQDSTLRRGNSQEIKPVSGSMTGEIKPQTHSDKLLEMMSFRSLLHMGQIQIGMAKADRLAQASSYTLDYSDNSVLYVHVDGEGYMINEPCRIEVSHSDQIYMNINKVQTKTSKYLGDILKVLEEAMADKTISLEQKQTLYEKFVYGLN